MDDNVPTFAAGKNHTRLSPSPRAPEWKVDSGPIPSSLSMDSREWNALSPDEKFSQATWRSIFPSR